MIGLLVITHCQLAKELLEAAGFIVGSIEAAEHISIDTTLDSQVLRDMIGKKIKFLDKGQGVLILTDMFGGTPSNLALSFLQKDKIEVVTGINLPMVIAVAHNRNSNNLAEIANIAKNAGSRSISLASELLKP
ncbi:MAG TPA: PTS fructose transporter subunit IIA, partial [Desulfatiglandales bacterium]|nr:PTS fructose transporter subunit IIA [Desulfatiglandales bacterium]